jgi:hypothetical protein
VRKTFKCGAPITPENSYKKAGNSRCLQCKRMYARQYYRQKSKEKQLQSILSKSIVKKINFHA